MSGSHLLYRHGSHRATIAKKHRDRRRVRMRTRRQNVEELESDLKEWHAMVSQRRALADAAAERGDSWEAQAAAEALPVDARASKLHRACAALIAEHDVRRGFPVWTRQVAGIGPVDDWCSFERAAQVPSGVAFRALVSDSLSFPLTAAYAARTAGVAAEPSSGRLSLVVLGPEVGSELSGRSKWAELLGAHGLGARELCVLFCGPRVPKSLSGTEQTQEHRDGLLRFGFVRGAWHEPEVQARVPAGHRAPQLALAFNSGLCDFARGWLPTMRDLYWTRGLPLACTSYHQPEAELDARTLAVRVGVPAERMECAPNPFASKLPHLDELFPGRAYSANAFLIISRPSEKSKLVVRGTGIRPP